MKNPVVKVHNLKKHKKHKHHKKLTDETLIFLEEDQPRGTYGGILHALTGGILGNQKERLNR
jgi:hypothetical protein